MAVALMACDDIVICSGWRVEISGSEAEYMRVERYRK